MEDTNTQWHPGFIGAMDLEFKEDRGMLSFEKEHNLNTKPLQVDLLIIKKEGAGSIHNEIGEIFRKYNIVEYKSPKQHLDVDVFYKTGAYASLYKSYGETVDGRAADDMTVTIVREGKPEGLFQYFMKRGIPVENPHPGIYYVLGEALFPTQIIVGKELDKKQHSWLKSLSSNVGEEDLRKVLEDVRKLKDKPDRESADSVLEVLLRENRGLVEKMMGDDSMSDALLEIMEPKIKEIMEPKIIEIRRQARTEGLEHGKMESAKRMLESGRLSIEEVTEYSGLTAEQVHNLKKKMQG